MNAVRKLLGVKKKDGQRTGDDKVRVSLSSLKDTEELLRKKISFVESQIDEMTKLARKHGLSNKPAAKTALKRRGLLQKQQESLIGMLTNVETQIDALAGVKLNKSVVEALGAGNSALKSANEAIGVDKVYDLMDSVAEQQDLAQEIVDAMTQPIGGRADFDEDELNAELEALAQEELDKALLTITPGQDAKVESVEANDSNNGSSSEKLIRAEELDQEPGTSQVLKRAEVIEEEVDASAQKLLNWSIS